MTRRSKAAVLLAVVASVVTGPPTAAQSTPVAWQLLGELTGTFSRFTALAFRDGASPDGSLDTLYVGSTAYLYRYPPGGPLSQPIHQTGGGNESVIATPAGVLLAGDAPGQLDRSADGARTWEEVHDYPPTALLQSTASTLDSEAIAAFVNEIWSSTSDGAAGSWERRGFAEAEVETLHEVSAGPHAGRLLAGLWNGASYSDDGGATWVRSNLWLPGGMIVRSLAFHPEAGHPAGGVSFAGVRSKGQPFVYRSDDAGATWVLARIFEDGEFGLADPNWVTVAVGPDGVVWAGLWDAVGGSAPNPGTVARSLDGGQTWEHAADGYGGWAVRAFAFGRDGRLYLAADRGVWRTTTPVVATEPERPDRGGRLQLEVRPNPSAGTIAVTLGRAVSGTARIVLYDVLGRDVAVLYDGTLPGADLRLTWQTDGLPPGSYVLRAEAGGHSATAQVTVGAR